MVISVFVGAAFVSSVAGLPTSFIVLNVFFMYHVFAFVSPLCLDDKKLCSSLRCAYLPFMFFCGWRSPALYIIDGLITDLVSELIRPARPLLTVFFKGRPCATNPMLNLDRVLTHERASLIQVLHFSLWWEDFHFHLFDFDFRSFV